MSRSRSLFAAFAAAALIASSAFACAFARVRERVVDAFHSVMRFVFGAMPAPVRGDKLDTKASRRLTAASSFVERMVKREKPRIEQRWAMCPST